MERNAGVRAEIGNFGGYAAAVQKWSALLGGGALALFGLTRRSKSGVALAAAGGALAYYGATANTQPKVLAAHSSTVVNTSPQQAYRFWRNFEEFPLFMRHLESVTNLGNGRSKWVAIGPFGKKIEWQAEIVSEREGEVIAWRSLPNSDVTVDGFVQFKALPEGRGTMVLAEIVYGPPAGALGHALAKIVGKDPNFLMRQDLRRFKALIETGEIPTVEGQSHGPRSGMAAAARLLDPDQSIKGDYSLPEVLAAQRRVS